MQSILMEFLRNLSIKQITYYKLGTNREIELTKLLLEALVMMMLVSQIGDLLVRKLGLMRSFSYSDELVLSCG